MWKRFHDWHLKTNSGRAPSFVEMAAVAVDIVVAVVIDCVRYDVPDSRPSLLELSEGLLLRRLQPTLEGSECEMLSERSRAESVLRRHQVPMTLRYSLSIEAHQ